MNCIFCKIAAGEIPTPLVFSNEHVIAFHDLNPQAPTHILIIPIRHIESINALVDAETEHAAGQCLRAAREIARQQNLSHGYRLVTNTGQEGGQAVMHLHFHLLAGRRMNWPPG